MQTMDNLEDHLRQFWENQTTPSQRREILRQLEESGMEWKDFLQQYYNKVLAGEEAHGLDDARKDRVWQRLRDQHLGQGETGQEETGQEVDGRRRMETGQEVGAHRRMDIGQKSDSQGTNTGQRKDGRQGVSGRVVWYRWMAAASVLLIISLCIRQWSRTPSAESTTTKQTAAVKVIVKKTAGAGGERLTLPDNSLVLLAPGSSIRYLEHFEAGARNIQLEGRALFEVAKDSARPFTVTARGFATTALGTRFIVDATRPHISIRLLKGKIVVNATPDADMPMQKVYLSPGQELKINTETKHFDLGNSFEDSLKQSMAHTRKQRQNNTGAGVTALSFERTSLEAVFRRLSEYYKTSILFDKAEVQGLSFTGAFEPTDDLDLALKVICNMNQLTFTKENDRIRISKQQ